MYYNICYVFLQVGGKCIWLGVRLIVWCGEMEGGNVNLAWRKTTGLALLSGKWKVGLKQIGNR